MTDRAETIDVLAGFREQLYLCMTRRADALFELTDALLCTDGPVKTLVGLSLAPEHRRGHGAMYDALNAGRIDVESLRRQLAGLPLPRAADGRLVLAVDVSPWLRPDGNCSPQRSFCHTYGRGRDEHRMIPGWPYSIVAALETGRTSWTALLDAVRLPPGADVTTITCAQIRQLVERLTDAGQWQVGDFEGRGTRTSFPQTSVWIQGVRLGGGTSGHGGCIAKLSLVVAHQQCCNDRLNPAPPGPAEWGRRRASESTGRLPGKPDPAAGN